MKIIDNIEDIKIIKEADDGPALQMFIDSKIQEIRAFALLPKSEED